MSTILIVCFWISTYVLMAGVTAALLDFLGRLTDEYDESDRPMTYVGGAIWPVILPLVLLIVATMVVGKRVTARFQAWVGEEEKEEAK